MSDSSILTRFSNLFPAPVDIAAARCCEGPGRHQIENRDCETSSVRIKLVTTCRNSTRRLSKLTGSGWINYLTKDFKHGINERNTVVVCLVLLCKWQRRSARACASSIKSKVRPTRSGSRVSLPLRLKNYRGKTFRVRSALKNTLSFFLSVIFR